MTISIITLSQYAKCRVLLMVMLNVTILSVIALNIVMLVILNLILLNVVMMNDIMLSVIMWNMKYSLLKSPSRSLPYPVDRGLSSFVWMNPVRNVLMKPGNKTYKTFFHCSGHCDNTYYNFTYNDNSYNTLIWVTLLVTDFTYQLIYL